ncbi:MAG: PadR family transcriptional regulator [Acidimicrobiales bacterium]
MTRLFGRGELKQALLHVVADLGPTNGYSIMHGLAERIGGTWRPSPGAIYPALLALEDAGLLAGRDEAGARRYEVTAKGRVAVAAEPDVIEEVAGRALRAPAPAVTVGAVLDRLAAAAPLRRLPADTDQTHRIERAFQPVLDEINRMTAEEAP